MTDDRALPVGERRQELQDLSEDEVAELLSKKLSAAEDRHRYLQEILGADKVGLVHGRLPAREKDAVMARFASGELSVLVATTVIEVGVDVPAASIMIDMMLLPSTMLPS